MLTLLQSHRKTSAIGMDFANGAVRAVQLHRDHDRWVIGELIDADCPSSLVLKDSDACGRWIRECLDRGTFKGRRIVTSIGPPDLEIHAVELPNVNAHSELELEDIVHWEIKRLASPDLGEIETAHWQIPKGMGRTPNVLGIAASQMSVSFITRMCQQAGYECTCIDVSPCAITRAGLMLKHFGADEVWGILELGLRQSRLVLCLGDIPVLARSVGIGGKAWTQVIAENLKLSVDAAEIHKCDHGIATAKKNGSDDPMDGVQAVTSSTPNHELATMIYGVLRQTLSKMVEEIERSYSYVLSCYPKAKATDLILSGGGACMSQLPEHLQQHLGISVTRVGGFLDSPHCRITNNPSIRFPIERCFAAIGMAMEPEIS